MSGSTSLKLRKLKFAFKDFPLREVGNWYPYVNNYLRYGFHKNHIRQQSIAQIRSDRFVRYLTEKLAHAGTELSEQETGDERERYLPKRILLTNSTIGGRSGTEVWVYEMVHWLEAQGAEVLVYAPNLNHKNPDSLNSVRHTTSQKEALDFAPDLVHAQHAGHRQVGRLLDKMKAYPTFNMIHGIADQLELPIRPGKHRRLCYGGASLLICAKASFITGTETALLKNFAESINDFRPARQPRKAMTISTKIGQETRDRLEELLRQQNIAYSGFGHSPSTFIWDYDEAAEMLSAYDVVLCTGKTAIDFLGRGFHVMLCEGPLLGPIVTDKNYRLLSDMNFALASSLIPAVNIFSDEASTWLKDQMDQIPDIDTRRLQQMRDSENTLNRVGQHLLEIYASLQPAKPDSTPLRLMA